MQTVNVSTRARPNGATASFTWPQAVPCGRMLRIGAPVALVGDTFYCKPCADLVWVPAHVPRHEMRFDRGGRCGGAAPLD